MPIDLIVKFATEAEWNGRVLRCAIGRGGVVAAADKTEGDGATPAGGWVMREVFYRADKMPRPETSLPVRAMEPDDGWCDAPQDAHYNRLVKHPYPASAEELWRNDDLYDVVVVLGHNDDPVVAGRGSAIFLHVARPDYGPSGGCVHLSREDLLAVLHEATEGSAVTVPLLP